MRFLAGLAVAASVLVSPRPSRAEGATSVAQCYDAHETGQLQRKRGELRKARASFAACGQTSCPSIVQHDCVAWAAELVTQQPSIVIAVVRNDGTDVLGASVSIDGAPVTVDGRTLDVDPGVHRMRVEVPGEPPLEQRFAVREGERSRRVAVVVASKEQRHSRLAPPMISYVLGGVSVLALASFGTFAWAGKSRENELARTCVDRCSDDDVAGVRTSFVIADLSLGVAAIAAGAAILTWVFAPNQDGSARKASK